jgi:hypothetical protein
MLKRLQYEVSQAENGQLCVDIFKESARNCENQNNNNTHTNTNTNTSNHKHDNTDTETHLKTANDSAASSYHSITLPVNKIAALPDSQSNHMQMKSPPVHCSTNVYADDAHASAYGRQGQGQGLPEGSRGRDAVLPPSYQPRANSSPPASRRSSYTSDGTAILNNDVLLRMPADPPTGYVYSHGGLLPAPAELTARRSTTGDNKAIVALQQEQSTHTHTWPVDLILMDGMSHATPRTTHHIMAYIFPRFATARIHACNKQQLSLVNPYHVFLCISSLFRMMQV